MHPTSPTRRGLLALLAALLPASVASADVLPDVVDKSPAVAVEAVRAAGFEELTFTLNLEPSTYGSVSGYGLVVAWTDPKGGEDVSPSTPIELGFRMVHDHYGWAGGDAAYHAARIGYTLVEGDPSGTYSPIDFGETGKVKGYTSKKPFNPVSSGELVGVILVAPVLEFSLGFVLLVALAAFGIGFFAATITGKFKAKPG